MSPGVALDIMLSAFRLVILNRGSPLTAVSYATWRMFLLLQYPNKLRAYAACIFTISHTAIAH